MIIYEIRNEREFLVALLLSNRYSSDDEVMFLNLSEMRLPQVISEFSSIKLVDVSYSSLWDKVSYQFLNRYLPADEDKVYVFHDSSPLVRGRMKTILVEHGLINYMSNEEVYSALPLFSKLISKVFYSGLTSGRSDLIESVIYTLEDSAPSDLKHKAVYVDLFKLWFSLEESKRSFINDLYKVSSLSIEKDYVLVMTQPLEIFDGVSEEIKLEIYKKVCALYKDKIIVIKPHPREQTDYSSISDYTLTSTYPSELIGFNSERLPSEVVTLFSTAAFVFFNSSKVTWLGPFDRRLEKVVGEIKLPESLKRLLNNE